MELLVYRFLLSRVKICRPKSLYILVCSYKISFFTQFGSYSFTLFLCEIFLVIPMISPSGDPRHHFLPRVSQRLVVKILIRVSVLVHRPQLMIDSLLSHLVLVRVVLLRWDPQSLKQNLRTSEDWSKAWSHHTFLLLMRISSVSCHSLERLSRIHFFLWENEMRLFFLEVVFLPFRMQEQHTKPFLICDYPIAKKIISLDGFSSFQDSIRPSSRRY